ncbi:MAG: GNAT family N-acetyltransferase [Pseudomonadota bacterium]
MEPTVAEGGKAAPVLETERLTLRAYGARDFEAFANYFSSERSRHTDGPIGRSAAWDRFSTGVGNWALLGYGAWSVLDRWDGRLIGLVSLNPPLLLPEPELGWILYLEADEGKGLALEAARRARTFASDALGLQGLLSCIDAGNPRSANLAERLGARRDRTLVVPGEPQTLVYRHW